MLREFPYSKLFLKTLKCRQILAQSQQIKDTRAISKVSSFWAGILTNAICKYWSKWKQRSKHFFVVVFGNFRKLLEVELWVTLKHYSTVFLYWNFKMKIWKFKVKMIKRQKNEDNDDFQELIKPSTTSFRS